MSMKLSKDKEHLVLENQKLVHYLVLKLGITQKSSEYNDFVSTGMIGLVKAAITFDSSKNFAFSTYASRCINNELFKHYRKANKYANDISIDEPISNDGEGNELTLGDITAHSDSNFVDELVNKEDFIHLTNLVLNYFQGKQRLVMLYRMGSTTQGDTAAKLNMTQSNVSRIFAKTTCKIKKIANHQIHFKEVFSMAIVGDAYRISFSSKDVKNFNKIFASLLQNLTSAKGLPNFKVTCNNERIVVLVPAHPESFNFIAKIIQEIDDFSLSFISNKDTLPTAAAVLPKLESDNSSKDDGAAKEIETSEIEQNSDILSDVVDEPEIVQTETDTVETIEESTTSSISHEVLDVDTVEKTTPNNSIIEDTVSTLADTNAIVHTNTNSAMGRNSQVQQVRDYFLGMKSFTSKELKEHFPSLTDSTIRNALYLAKSKGLITSTGRGQYCVNSSDAPCVETNHADESHEFTHIAKDNTSEGNISETTG